MSLDSPVAILYNSDGYELASKDGYVVTANVSGLMCLGTDGTNARYVKTDSSGRLVFVGLGTAGSPLGGVLSIQGVVSGTVVPVSGTVAATQSGTWNINNVSGTISLPTGAATESSLVAQSIVDNAGFTDGTTRIQLAGFVFDEAAGIALTENDAAAGRIDSKRAQILVLEDATTRGQRATVNASGRLDTNLGSWLGSTTPTVGTKLMAESIPVTISSDQTAIAVSSAPADSIAGFTRGDVTTAVIATVAVRATAYTEQTSNAQRSIVSTSAADTAAGTGARTVEITYYTSAGVGPSTEIVTLNGTVAVNTVSTTICFIEKMEIVTAGSGAVNAGTINLKAATGGGGATIGSIAIGDNTTLWAHHYVPTGMTANITSQWAGHTGTTVGSGGTFVIRSLQIGVANAVEVQISDKFRLYGQSSSVQRNYGSPIVVTGPARLVTYVLPETSTSVNYRASFDYYEV